MSDTVKDDNTGEEVPVTQVHAVAALAATSSVRGDLPRGSAELIQRAMSTAAADAIEKFGHDADKIRGAMLEARAAMKVSIRNHLNDLASQQAAAERAAQEK